MWGIVRKQTRRPSDPITHLYRLHRETESSSNTAQRLGRPPKHTPARQGWRYSLVNRHKSRGCVALSASLLVQNHHLVDFQVPTMSPVSPPDEGGSVIRSGMASLLHHIGWKGAVVIFAHVILAQVIYRFYLDPLRHIPGPTAARFTELWRTRRYALGGWHQDILDLHDKYGSVVRIAPNEISFVDKDALTQVYGHSTGTKKVRCSPRTRTKTILTSFRRPHGITRGASRACRTLYVSSSH